jgi:mxaD protein
MKRIVRLAASLALLVPVAAFAQAKELTTTQVIRIKATPDKVWAYVGDFGGISRWFPPAVESKLVLRDRNELGAIRQLVRRNGTRVTEKLVEYDPYNLRLTYTYVDGQVMASDYFSTVSLKDLGNGETEVLWGGRFTRIAYWQDPPPEGQDDASVTAFFAGVYKAGLETLKKVVEEQ